jgi:hypothetical protein
VWTCLARRLEFTGIVEESGTMTHGMMLTRAALPAGDMRTLLDHFAPINLQQLHLAGVGITGEMPPICLPGSAFARLTSFSARNVAVRGVLPPCLWQLQHFALTETMVQGTIPKITAGAAMQSLHLDTVRFAVPTASSFEKAHRLHKCSPKVQLRSCAHAQPLCHWRADKF